MKFIFVVGGSYRSFYINKLNTIKNIDLIIFNNGVFDEINYCDEEVDIKVFTDEIKELNKLLKCSIVVCCNINKFGNRYKAFVLCVNQKISIISPHKDIYLYIKGELILITSKLYKNLYAFATICTTDYGDEIIKRYIKFKNGCFILRDKSVTQITGGKIYRKFKKCCEFILKKNK